MRINELKTPCYVIDEGKLIKNLEILQDVEKDTGCKILLAQKAFSCYYEYPLIKKYISGTTSSGLYEARLGKEEMNKENHVYAPAFKEEDIKEIVKICEEHNVPILEDAAEGLGTIYEGKYLGTYGKCAALSFNGNKIITTTGGGMFVSNDEEMANKVRFWSTQSKDPARHYQHSEIGYNYRMSNVLAGIGRGQMKVLEKRIEKKNEIFETYKNAFKDIEDIEMMPENENERSNQWLSAMTLKENSKVKPLDIILALEKENIESRPVWKPMHLQPVFEKYDFINENETGISVGEDLFNRGVCLPSDTKMTAEDMEKIITIIRSVF